MIVMVNLADQPCFFIKTVVGLAIDGAVSMGIDITIGFSGLFL